MKTYHFITMTTGGSSTCLRICRQANLIEDLQIIAGADEMPDIIPANGSSVILIIAKEAFEGAELPELTEKCDPVLDGGYYLVQYYAGQEIIRTVVYQVTEFVFGNIRDRIFIKKAVVDLV